MNSFASDKQDANKSARSASLQDSSVRADVEGRSLDNRDEPVSLARLQKADPKTVSAQSVLDTPIQLVRGSAKKIASIAEEGITAEELAGVEGPRGEGAQIDTGKAKLTRTARFKGFFGNESTYSKFLSKVDEFNVSQDVVQKQEILVELRSLARLWLQKHKEDVENNFLDKDQNEREKLFTVNRFLKQTNSNYPKINQLYDNLESKISGFRANPIAKKEDFQSAVRDYKFLQSKVEQHKEEYPPSVNLMYAAEIQGIKELEAKIQRIGKGEKKAPDFDPKPPFPALPFSIKSPTVGFSVMDGTYGFKGALNFDIGNISSSSGEVSVNFNPDGSFGSAAIANGKFTANIDGMDFEAEGITYNSESGTISVETATSNITMFKQSVKLTINGGSIVHNEFNFAKIESELPDAKVGFFTVKNPVISYETEGKVFKGKADYEFNPSAAPAELGNLSATGKGKADILWSREVDANRWVEISDGVLDFNLLGQHVHADKMTFSSRGDNPTLAAKTASLDLNLPIPGSEQPLSQKIEGKGISISKNNGFTFDSLQAEREVKMESDLFSLTAKSIALKKEAPGNYKAEAAGDVQFDKLGAMGISAQGIASGSVGLPLQAPHTPDYKITAASAKATMKNPLQNNLSEYFGGKFSAEADIPVFPFIYANFGMFVESKATLPPSFSVSFNFDAQTQDLTITANHEPATAQIEAGVEGGLKAGLPPLAALKIALSAGGKIAAKAWALFTKTFNLGKKEKPKVEDKTDKKALEFHLKGEIALQAKLKLVAQALYFFKTTKSFDLGEKNLGEFELSNVKGDQKKQITPRSKAEPLGEESALKDALPNKGEATEDLKKLKGKEFADALALEGDKPPKKSFFGRIFNR